MEEENIRLGKVVETMEADIINIDRENLRLDEENRRLIGVTTELEEAL